MEYAYNEINYMQLWKEIWTDVEKYHKLKWQATE